MKIARQDLTPEKLVRSNKVAASVMIISYFNFLLVELDAVNHGGFTTAGIIRCAVYLLVGFLNFYMVKKIGDTRKCMVLMCLSFTVLYAVLGVTHDPLNLTVVFPVLIGLTVYLNARLLLLGSACSSAVVISRIIKYARLGDLSHTNDSFFILLCVLLTALITTNAIGLLIRFSQEDQEEIEEKSKKQKEVSNAVATIVTDINKTFDDTLESMDKINAAMNQTNIAVENIAANSEQTANTASRQVEMTTEIQNQLEETAKNANIALETTEELLGIISGGVASAAELKTQSEMVNENTNNISAIIERLVQNVEQVTSITDSILNISSQTNLLALNASIEAARAGDAGRGFAVVADEIRKLAEETRLSTEQITNIMNELNSVTKDTQAEIQNSVDSIRQQNEKVQEVTNAFENAGANIEKLSAGVSDMSGSVDAVLEANAIIVDSIQSLSGASQEVSAETESSRGQIDEVTQGLLKFSDSINETSEQLRNLEKVAVSE